MIEVLQAAERGEEIECAPICSEQWRPKCHPDWTFNYFDYRIKPKPRMVPLEPSDVPPGSVIGTNGSHNAWSLVTSVGNQGVCCAGYAGAFMITWDDLRSNRYEISRDGGRTWSRCEKPESI